MTVQLLINEFLCASSLVLPHASFVMFICRQHFYISKKHTVFGTQKYNCLVIYRNMLEEVMMGRQPVIRVLTLLCKTSLLNLITIHLFGTFTVNQSSLLLKNHLKPIHLPICRIRIKVLTLKLHNLKLKLLVKNLLLTPILKA